MPGIPGSEGQFSLLQAALAQGSDGRVRVSEAVKQQLHTCLDLLDNPQPTLFEELVPGHPTHIGELVMPQNRELVACGFRTRVKLINPTMMASH